MIQYDGDDYDLNALFQFDVLKKLNEALAKYTEIESRC